MKFSTPLTRFCTFLVPTLFLLALSPAQARDRFFGPDGIGRSRAEDRSERNSEDRDRRVRRFLHRLSSDSPGGPKRVEVDLSEQKLRAWEGDRLVMQTHISSGRNASTPTGRFAASYKAREHYSTLYHHAYMPYSVQVAGDVFIHGYSEVPRYPASHGCIRVPVTGRNPAKQFFEWVTPGTPVRIVD